MGVLLNPCLAAWIAGTVVTLRDEAASRSHSSGGAAYAGVPRARGIWAGVQRDVVPARHLLRARALQARVQPHALRAAWELRAWALRRQVQLLALRVPRGLLVRRRPLQAHQLLFRRRVPLGLQVPARALRAHLRPDRLPQRVVVQQRRVPPHVCRAQVPEGVQVPRRPLCEVQGRRVPSEEEEGRQEEERTENKETIVALLYSGVHATRRDARMHKTQQRHAHQLRVVGQGGSTQLP